MAECNAFQGRGRGRSFLGVTLSALPMFLAMAAFRPATGQSIVTTYTLQEFPANFYWFHVSPDNRFLYTYSTAFDLNPATGRILEEHHDLWTEGSNLGFAAGDQLNALYTLTRANASSGYNYSFRCFSRDAATGQVSFASEQEFSTSAFFNLSVSWDGRWVANTDCLTVNLAATEGNAFVYSARLGLPPTFTTICSSDYVAYRAFSGDSRTLFVLRTASPGPTLYAFDLERSAGTASATLGATTTPISSATYVVPDRGDPRYLLVVSPGNGRVDVYEYDPSSKHFFYLATTVEPTLATNLMLFSPDGQWIATAFSDQISLWSFDSDTFEIHLQDRVSRFGVNFERLAFSPDCTRLYAGADGSIAVLQLAASTHPAQIARMILHMLPPKPEADVNGDGVISCGDVITALSQP